MAPKISIIVPCRQIDQYLRENLRQCLTLDYPYFEVLVLPDSETTMDSPVIKVIATGPVAPADKRDIGAQHASGEILAFIDDDAYPTKCWLKEAVKYLEDDKVAAVGGPAVTPPEDSLLQKASGWVYSSFLGGGGLSFRYVPKQQREVADYPSCNFLVKKSVFEQVGGFSTLFWPGEDTKLCLEITKALDKKIVYAPEVLVYHHRRKLFAPHLKQIWSYAVHRGYFAKKYSRTSLRPSYFLPSLFCLGLVIGIPASVFNPMMRLAFLSIVSIYLLLALISSSQSKDAKAMPLVFLGIISTHITYGIGFMKGLLSGNLAQ